MSRFILGLIAGPWWVLFFGVQGTLLVAKMSDALAWNWWVTFIPSAVLVSVLAVIGVRIAIFYKNFP